MRKGVPLLLAVVVATATACVTRTTTATVTPMLPTATVSVPNVLGLGWSAARREIKSRGLTTQAKVVTGPYPTGVVTQQRPGAGANVPPGTAVHVVIGPA